MNRETARKTLIDLIERAEKVVTGPVSEYQRSLEGGFNHMIGRGQYVTRADRNEYAADVRKLIRAYAERIYVSGIERGGITEIELSDEDEAAISAWIESQRGAVGGFADAVQRAAPDPAQYSGITARMMLWVRAAEDLEAQGFASAKKNMMVTWRYGDTDHCETCQSLNGKRRRLSWFTSRGYYPRQVGSETLECGGWRCQCKLVDDSGKQVL